MPEPIQVNFELTLFLGGLSAFILFFAFSRGFFTLSKEKEKLSLKFTYVFVGFSIYFFLVLFLPPVLLKWIIVHLDTFNKIDDLSFANCLTLFIVSIALYSFSKVKDLKQEVHLLEKKTFFKDIWTGLLAWLIATPIVLFVSQLFDLFIFFILKIETIPEQLAVQFIKATLESNPSFFFALVSVVFLAPFVEEFLFRGLLQTWLKKILGSSTAIVISSISFSLFHFSKLQKIGNLSILGALFPLAFFLGFIYEKQRSLIAPIALHMIFNTSSLVSLIFF